MELYLAFVAATVLLMLIPGPNVALIVANSVAYGTRYGLLTVAGTSAAMVPQLLVAALGMAALLAAVGTWFEWLRWAGVVYLLWLGAQHWRAPAEDLTQTRAEPPLKARIFGRGLLVSLTNPKTLLFYGAFFPQFVTAEAAIGPQVALLSATFLAVAVTVDSGWALLAGRARPLLARRGRLRNRLTGGLLIGAAAGLAMARREP
jgi:threonine/homoserine/homoserine lactone efflux protein